MDKRNNERTKVSRLGRLIAEVVRLREKNEALADACRHGSACLRSSWRSLNRAGDPFGAGLCERAAETLDDALAAHAVGRDGTGRPVGVAGDGARIQVTPDDINAFCEALYDLSAGRLMGSAALRDVAGCALGHFDWGARVRQESRSLVRAVLVRFFSGRAAAGSGEGEG